MYNTLVCG